MQAPDDVVKDGLEFGVVQGVEREGGQGFLRVFRREFRGIGRVGGVVVRRPHIPPTLP